MHLEEFSAEGRLDADAADELTWATTRYASRIHLTVGDRRLLAQNLAVCWDDLGIRPGTRVFIEVANPVGDLTDEQRTISGFVARFHELMSPPPPTDRSIRWRDLLVKAVRRRLH